MNHYRIKYFKAMGGNLVSSIRADDFISRNGLVEFIIDNEFIYAINISNIATITLVRE